MDIPFWVKTLEKREPVTADKWKKMSVLNRWGHFANRDTLMMTVIPAASAGMLALMAGFFDPAKWVLLVIGLVFAHAFNNMFNDFSDTTHGVDKGDYLKEHIQYPPTHHGYLTQKQALVYMAATGIIALTAGISLVAKSGALTIWLLILGIIFNIFYVYPIKVFGLGEISTVIVWGPLMFGGGYYVLSGQWDWNVALFGAAYGISVATVLMGRHLDKITHDRKQHIFTIPVLVGETAARQMIFALILLQYLIIIYQFISAVFSPIILTVLLGALLTLPMMVRAYLSPKPGKKPDKFPESAWHMWFIAPALYNNTLYGYAFILALALESAIRSANL
jgi:1,4-dihydroxy-2-naphthoate octaprenyltransferase